MTMVRLEPVAPPSRVKHSTTEPLCSLYVTLKLATHYTFCYFCQTTCTFEFTKNFLCLHLLCLLKTLVIFDSVNLFYFESVVCGFTIHQKIWNPQINSELLCELESNKFDKNAAAVSCERCEYSQANSTN